MSTPQELEFSVALNGLTDLTRIILPDSSVTFVKTVQVGMPLGSSARLVTVDGAGIQAFESQETVSGASRPLAALAKPRLVRGRQLMAIEICPVTGSGYYSQVHLRLAFSGGESSVAVAADPIFDKLFASTVVNFDQFKNWGAANRVAARATVEFDPFVISDEWLKLTVRQTGLHRVTGAQLEAAGLSLTNLRSDSIRVFNGGGKPNEMDNAKPRPEFREIALKIEDGGDGQFGSSDVLYFYGEATSRWIHADSQVPSWLTNVFTNDNIYWLTVAAGGFGASQVRMATYTAAPSGSADTTVTTFRRRVHVEQDNVLLTDDRGHVEDYYEWYWTDQTSLSMFVPTPGVEVGDSARVVAVGRTGVSGANQHMSIWHEVAGRWDERH